MASEQKFSRRLFEVPISIDRSKLPKVSGDSTIVLNLVSNQEKTKFAVEGKELGVAKRMYVLVPDRPLTIKAKPEGYIEKEDFIQPPYHEYTQIGFYFLREDREQNQDVRRTPSFDKEALSAITEAAAQICQTVPLRSENQTLKLNGKGNAELSGVIKKIVGLGISGAAQYESGSSNGVCKANSPAQSQMATCADLKCLQRYLPPF